MTPEDYQVGLKPSNEIRRLMIACDKDMMAECRKAKLSYEAAHDLTSQIWMLLKTKLALSEGIEIEKAYEKGKRDGFKEGLLRRDSFDRIQYENRRENV